MWAMPGLSHLSVPGRTSSLAPTNQSERGLQRVVIAFNVLLHILLVGSLFLFLFAVVKLALVAVSPMERAIRVMALVAAVLLVLGASTAGVGYANFAVDALSGARTASAAAKLGTAVVPGMVGVGIGFYIIRVYRKSTLKAIRVVCFVGMLTVVAFIQLYAAAAQAKGVILGTAAIPNVTFILGLVLVIVFTSDAEDEIGTTTKNGASAMWDFFNGKAREAATRKFMPGRVGNAVPDPLAGKVDPFS